MNWGEFDSEEFSPEDRTLLVRADGGEPGAADDLDLATAREFLRVSRSPANAAFARTVAASTPGGPPPRVKIGLVPGAFYLEHTNTGADGAMVRRILAGLGHEAELIPVQSFGSLTDNARIICEWLRRPHDAPVILVSLSKGAADVKTALHLMNTSGSTPPDFAAWISLTGISTGTPLVKWLRRRPWRWWGVWLLLRLRGQNIGVLHELRHGPDAPLAQWPDLPPGLQIVHIHGFPLRRHLNHPWAAKAYKRLAALGPNDGGSVLLADIARWPGIVFPLWGVDHYMQPRHDITARLSRVLQTVLAHCD